MPIPSVLARKRSIRTNPLVGSKRGKGRVAADPKTVSVLDRVKDHTGENFIVSTKKLFCSACREEVVLKKGLSNRHFARAQVR